MVWMENLPTTEREQRGKSIIAFPENYVVVDTETTGLSPAWDHIIEIGAVRYRNGYEVDRFASLVQPPSYDDGTFVDSFITELTGITNEMLAEAPPAKEVLEAFDLYLGEDLILGYNVGFDVNFFYEKYLRYLGKPFANNYIDIMRFSRKLYPDMAHHRLKDMVKKFQIKQEHSHRAVADVEATQQCYRLMMEEALRIYASEEAFQRAFSRKRYRAASICADTSKANPDSPLYGRYCVFTGKLEKYTRKEAMQIVADLGGIMEDGVTKKTNFLILGNNDYCKAIKDGKSAKHKKAEKLKLSGQDIEIIPETVFYDMLREA